MRFFCATIILLFSSKTFGLVDQAAACFYYFPLFKLVANVYKRCSWVQRRSQLFLYKHNLFKLESRQSYFCVKWHRLLLIDVYTDTNLLFSWTGQHQAGVLWWTCTIYFIELECNFNRSIKICPDLLNNILQYSSIQGKLVEMISVDLISSAVTQVRIVKKKWNKFNIENVQEYVTHEVRECEIYKYTKVHVSEKMAAVQAVLKMFLTQLKHLTFKM